MTCKCVPGCASGVERAAVRVQELAGCSAHIRSPQLPPAGTSGATAAALLCRDEAGVGGNGLSRVTLTCRLVAFGAGCANVRTGYAQATEVLAKVRGHAP